MELIKNKENLKDKKGSSVIEMVIGLFIFVVIFSFLFDLTMITWKLVTVSHVSNSLARTIGVQSGIQSLCPIGYSAKDDYKDSKSMKAQIDNLLAKANIKPEDYSIDITAYRKNGENSPTTTIHVKGTENKINPFMVDYGGYITATINIKYKWSILSSFSPLTFGRDNELSASRNATAEFKYNYDKWYQEEEGVY